LYDDIFRGPRGHQRAPGGPGDYQIRLRINCGWHIIIIIIIIIITSTPSAATVAA